MFAVSRDVGDNLPVFLRSVLYRKMLDFACLSCGACCAAFRVDFHCSDLGTATAPGVPLELVVPLTATLVRMRGTDDAPPRCAALAVGETMAGPGKRFRATFTQSMRTTSTDCLAWCCPEVRSTPTMGETSE